MDSKPERIQPKVREHFKWSEHPPPVNASKPRKIGPYQRIAEKMRKNKARAGQWALVAHDVHFTVVTRLRKQYPDIEWSARKNGARHDLWASLKKEPSEKVDVEVNIASPSAPSIPDTSIIDW